MQLLGRKQKFALGVLLVIWPVVVTALLPARYFSGLDIRFFSSDRIPAAYFSLSAFVSEALAIVLFLRAHRRLADRLSAWSVIGVAAAGAATLAFLAATVASAMQVW
jgi:hypothetical protein